MTAEHVDQQRSMPASGHANAERMFWNRFGSAVRPGHTESVLADRPNLWLERIIARLGDVRGRDVLDCGAGDGSLSRLLLASGATVTAFDMSDEMLRTAEARSWLRSQHALRLAAADFAALPFASETFDLAAGSFILHHVDTFHAIREIYRVLRPGGRAVFAETWLGNPLLAWARSHLVGRFGIARYGTLTEHPITRSDVAGMRRVFPHVRLHFPEFICLAKAGTNIFRWQTRYRPVTSTLVGASTAWSAVALHHSVSSVTIDSQIMFWNPAPLPPGVQTAEFSRRFSEDLYCLIELQKRAAGTTASDATATLAVIRHQHQQQPTPPVLPISRCNSQVLIRSCAAAHSALHSSSRTASDLPGCSQPWRRLGSEIEINMQASTVAALLLAVLTLIRATAGYHFNFELHPADPDRYRALAHNLVFHFSYSGSLEAPHLPEAMRTPGYPAFVAFIYAIWGTDDRYVFAVQAVMSTLVGLLLPHVPVGRGDRRRLGPYELAWIVYPFSIFYASQIMSEVLFMALTVSTAALSCRLWQEERMAIRRHLLLGVLAGLAVLTRPMGVILLLWIGIWTLSFFCAAAPSIRSWLWLARGWILSFAVAGLIISPWIARNWATFGQLSLAPGLGQGLFLKAIEVNRAGWNDFGAWSRDPEGWQFARYMGSVDGHETYHADSRMTARALEMIAQDLPGYIRTVLYSIVRFYITENSGTGRPFADRLVATSCFLLFAAAALTVAALWRRNWLIRRLGSLWILFSLLHAPLLTVARYSYAVAPITLWLVFVGSHELWTWARTRNVETGSVARAT